VGDELRVEMAFLQYSLEKNRLEDDINLLKNKLEAEEQLRIQAEAKSTLMHKELEKLHKMNSEHNLESDDLRHKIRQIRIECEIIDASRSDSDSISKVQEIVSEIQAEHTRTKEEVQNLRETNKILTHRTAHERQTRDQLLRQRAFYKDQLAKFPRRILPEDESPMEIEDVDEYYDTQMSGNTRYVTARPEFIESSDFQVPHNDLTENIIDEIF